MLTAPALKISTQTACHAPMSTSCAQAAVTPPISNHEKDRTSGLVARATAAASPPVSARSSTAATSLANSRRNPKLSALFQQGSDEPAAVGRYCGRFRTCVPSTGNLAL
jgi:hypothetical protein